jgi:hypothetical protein
MPIELNAPITGAVSFLQWVDPMWLPICLQGTGAPSTGRFHFYPAVSHGVLNAVTGHRSQWAGALRRLNGKGRILHLHTRAQAGLTSKPWPILYVSL